jgi:hypothetical protein
MTKETDDFLLKILTFILLLHLFFVGVGSSHRHAMMMSLPVRVLTSHKNNALRINCIPDFQDIHDTTIEFFLK